MAASASLRLSEYEGLLAGKYPSLQSLLTQSNLFARIPSRSSLIDACVYVDIHRHGEIP